MDKNKLQFSEFTGFYNNPFFLSVLDGIQNEKYSLSPEQYEDIFFNRLRHIKKINQHEPILISGCSMTVGGGINNEMIWPEILSKKMNMGYNTLAIPGSSVGQQVRYIYTYIKKYGAPKYLFALFPGFNRIEITDNKYYFQINEKKDPFPGYIQNINIESYTTDKFFKIPYPVESLLPLDMAQFYSNLQIFYLEEYCKALGIKFIWSTWHHKQYELLQKGINAGVDLYDGLINPENEKWALDFDKNKINYIENETIVNCHSEYLDKYPDDFYFAPDTDEGIQYAHWGVHRHIHIAESFFKEIE